MEQQIEQEEEMAQDIEVHFSLGVDTFFAPSSEYTILDWGCYKITDKPALS